MQSVIVLGGGMVGSVIAADLASGGEFDVAIADVSDAALARATARARVGAGGQVATVRADLGDPAEVKRIVADRDLVIGAIASRIGLQVLRAVIEAGKDYCDITFMSEDALALDGLAREHGVTAVVDCGVAPGMSNLLAGYGAHRLDEAREIEIYVGGLPAVREWPFEYKAGFAPHDVIEEYTRPARIVEHGRIVVREALSEPELMDFDGVGTLEAFNTDGLRSLAATLDVPDMKEKTLRYPGHIELMRVFRTTGLFGHEPVDVGGGVSVRPIDLLATLMFPKWTYGEGEEDLTVMRVLVTGTEHGRPVRLRWDLLDRADPETGFTSMARTTGFPCAIVARLIGSGRFRHPGVSAPEVIGRDASLVEHILAEHEKRGVRYEAHVL